MTVGEQAVEAEGIGVDRLAHVGDAMGAQDVERERADPGEDAGMAPDPAGVLAQDAVAHVMRPVLDPPVRSNRAPEALGIQLDLADVGGHLAARSPQAGAGVLAPGKARDPGGAGDGRLPFWRKPVGDREPLDPAMLLATMTAAVDRRVLVGWLLLGAQAYDGVMQARLVGLDPDQKGIAGVCRAGERFFWACSASAVNRTPRTPSASISACTAGTSSGAPRTSWCARINAASQANALSTCAAARSFRWSKLRLSALPSSAMTPSPGEGAALLSSRACWRKAASSVAGSSAWNRARRVLTAGARRKLVPNTAFRRSRCTAMNTRRPR